MKRQDVVVAPLCEAALVVVTGLAAWAAQTPLLFASLGPTAFELIEKPYRASARPYNLIVGHLIGVAAGFVGLIATRAWETPEASTGHVALARVRAAGIAALLTVFGTLLVKATQPAALSTTLVIALGSMQRWKDGPIIMAGVLIMTIVGEPVRRWRLAQRLEHGEED